MSEKVFVPIVTTSSGLVTAAAVVNGETLFVSVVTNGMGLIRVEFLIDWISAFNGRDILVSSLGDSHPGRAMNTCAAMFLNSPCERWLNLDCDTRFTRVSIDQLLAHDVELVFGMVPIKNDETPPCVCTFMKEGRFGYVRAAEKGLVEVRRAGRACMAVRRTLLEKLKSDNGGPAKRYCYSGSGLDVGVAWDFFPSGVVTGEASVYGEPEFVSEDFGFSELVRSIGGKVLLDSRVTLDHVGSTTYRFSEDRLTKIREFLKANEA
jgi:hypothetical protein